MGKPQVDDHAAVINKARKIIFYDGSCGLCQSSIQWLLRRDKKKQFYYATQQGELFTSITGLVNAGDAIVYYENGNVYQEAEALAYICRALGGIWPVFFWKWKILPRGLSRYLYNAIAKRRYNIFGKARYCQLPSPEDRKRML
jgi:predicted DCC family thiol-disulfide oxidoreductase YuxK